MNLNLRPKAQPVTLIIRRHRCRPTTLKLAVLQPTALQAEKPSSRIRVVSPPSRISAGN